MKTRLIRVLVMGATLTGLALWTGCEEKNAHAKVPVVTPVPASFVGEPVAVPVVAVEEPAPSIAPTVAPTPVANPAPAPASVPAEVDPVPAVQMVQEATTPENVSNSPALDRLVKMIQSGVEEGVVINYITNSPDAFNIGPDQIIYLNDLGVSTPIMNTLIQHDASPEIRARAQTAAVTAAPVPPAAPSNPPVDVTPAGTLPPAYQETAPVTAIAPAAPAPVQQTPVTVSYFYDYLTPYGNWVYVADYGMVWQPTVAVANVGWRPYSDHGRWLWTDNGWYWYSEYSWGWAPFHYGRWSHHARIGWFWVPDTHWGPAWVSWRYTHDHCGWAPLPPAVHYVRGGGLYYHGSNFSIGFDFGLTDFYYTFIPTRYFCHHSPHLYYVRRHDAPRYFRDSHVVNNYIINKTTIINQGVGYDRVSTATRGSVARAAIHEAPLPNRPGGRPEQLHNKGSLLVVNRPVLPKDPPPPKLIPARVADRRPKSGLVVERAPAPTTTTAPASTRTSPPKTSIEPKDFTKRAASATAPKPTVTPPPREVRKPSLSAPQLAAEPKTVTPPTATTRVPETRAPKTTTPSRTRVVGDSTPPRPSTLSPTLANPKPVAKPVPVPTAPPSKTMESRPSFDPAKRFEPKTSGSRAMVPSAGPSKPVTPPPGSGVRPTVTPATPSRTTTWSTPSSSGTTPPRSGSAAGPPASPRSSYTTPTPARPTPRSTYSAPSIPSRGSSYLTPSRPVSTPSRSSAGPTVSAPPARSYSAPPAARPSAPAPSVSAPPPSRSSAGPASSPSKSSGGSNSGSSGNGRSGSGGRSK